MMRTMVTMTRIGMKKARKKKGLRKARKNNGTKKVRKKSGTRMMRKKIGMKKNGTKSSLDYLCLCLIMVMLCFPSWWSQLSI